MIKKLLIILVIHFSMNVMAQEAFYKSYSWDEKPNYKKLSVDIDSDIMEFKNKIVTEFYFQEKNSLIEYFLEHRLIWLNSDERIEAYNKIYLPYSSNSELLVNKARVITKDGKVKVLDDSKILTATDDETKKTYKYFAFEGIEKGSFIEYYYVVKRFPNYRGKKIYFQSDYKKKNVEFDIFSPKNLVFEFKSYNGLKTVEQDTLSKDKLHWKLYVDSIKKLEEEEQSPYNASRKFLVYKLDKNTSSKTYGISSYDNVATRIYNLTFKELSKSESSNIDKLILNARLEKEKDDISKIRKLESYLKNNFYISNIDGDQFKDINKAINNKTASEIGLIKIYIAALNKLGIKTEVVLTSNRFDTKFDTKFEAYNFLTDYLLYFPSVKMFTSVKEIDSRLGFPPYGLTDNYGLFIKEVKVGSYKSGIGKIKFIEAPKDEETIDKMIIDVSFDEDDLTKSNISIDRSFSGYYALKIQPYLGFGNKEEINEFYDQIIKSVNESLKINKKSVYNDKSELSGIKPFQLVADTNSDAFVDKAGNKYLFKIGDVIGPQIEMYQNTERKLPLESDFNRKYIRIINVEIPKGYTISNLDDLNIYNFYEKDGEKLMEFHSYYEVNGNKLTVYADEFYKVNRIETEFFEDYRKVINSAADFNKIVLIMKPDNL